MNPYGFGYWSPLLVYDYFPTRYYGYRRYGFTPGVRSFSPSGLNLQRGPQVSTANRMYGANGRASWPRGAGLGNTMPPRPSFSGGRFGGGGASRGGFGGRR